MWRYGGRVAAAVEAQLIQVAVGAAPSARVAGRCQSEAAAAAGCGPVAGRRGVDGGGGLPRGCLLRGRSRSAPSRHKAAAASRTAVVGPAGAFAAAAAEAVAACTPGRRLLLLPRHLPLRQPSCTIHFHLNRRPRRWRRPRATQPRSPASSVAAGADAVAASAAAAAAGVAPSGPSRETGVPGAPPEGAAAAAAAANPEEPSWSGAETAAGQRERSASVVAAVVQAVYAGEAEELFADWKRTRLTPTAAAGAAAVRRLRAAAAAARPPRRPPPPRQWRRSRRRAAAGLGSRRSATCRAPRARRSRS